MDYLTQHFIAWARKEIERLIGRLNGIDEVLQRQIESKQKTDTSDHEHQYSPTILRAELKIPHSETYQDEARSARELVRETWKLYVEIFTLLVVFGYTTVAAFQLGEMKKASETAHDTLREIIKQYPELHKSAGAARDSADAADKNMRIEQRAWIGVAFHSFNPPKENEPIVITMVFSNTGKTPAKQVEGFTVVEELPVGNVPNFVYGNRAEGHLRGGMVIPNHAVEDPLQSLQFKPSTRQEESLKMSAGDIKAYADGRSYIVAHGIISYKDIFGTDHWIKFCSYQLSVPDMGGFRQFLDRCADQNKTDEN